MVDDASDHTIERLGACLDPCLKLKQLGLYAAIVGGMYTILERKIANIDFFAEHFWSSSSGIRYMVGKEPCTITA